MRIGLVGCVKSKQDVAAPARDLYTSALFRGRRAYVEQTCGGWFVLSAKYGIVTPDTVIAPYDVALKDASPSSREAWARDVLRSLEERVGSLGEHVFEIHAGSAYRDHGLVRGLRARGAKVEIPAAGLNQGQQLAFYAAARDGGRPIRPVAHPRAPHPGPYPSEPVRTPSAQQLHPAAEHPGQHTNLAAPAHATPSQPAAPSGAWTPPVQPKPLLARLRDRLTSRNDERSLAPQVPNPTPQVSRPPVAMHSPPSTPHDTRMLATVENVRELGPFEYRWPDATEHFGRGWEFDARLGVARARVRHGIGRRQAFGRERVHTVTWVYGQPVVEGAETEDYATSRALVGVLKRPDRKDARDLTDVPGGYEALRIVRHRDEIRGPNARSGLALKIPEDDLAAWATFALLRLRDRQREPRVDATPTHAPALAQSERDHPPARTSSEAEAVTRAILGFARSLHPSVSSFTPDPAADRFVREDAFAFLVAVIFDEQVRFEQAWDAPLELRRRLGHWDVHRIATERDAVHEAVRRPPALHRWVDKTPYRIVAAARRVVDSYGADASRIWSDKPNASALRHRFEEFEGISQKKSAMAVELLERVLGVEIDAMHGSDVAVDIHVRRVFLRSGLAERDDVSHMIRVARRLNPDRPGELDNAVWEIGRQWCRPTVPDCIGCPIGSVCPKLIGRADGVHGA